MAIKREAGALDVKGTFPIIGKTRAEHEKPHERVEENERVTAIGITFQQMLEEKFPDVYWLFFSSTSEQQKVLGYTPEEIIKLKNGMIRNQCSPDGYNHPRELDAEFGQDVRDARKRGIIAQKRS